MTDEIREQIKQLRASRPIDQRSDTGWDDLSSVRFQVAYTMERLLAVYETAKDVYEWADPSSELQQVEMLLLHDAMNAVQPEQSDD